jgi:hypothetical protein
MRKQLQKILCKAGLVLVTSFSVVLVCSVAPSLLCAASENTARIEAAPEISLESCDGKKVSSFSIKVPPGKHVVEMSYRSQVSGQTREYSSDTCFLVFTAEEGHTYRVDRTPASNGMYSGFVVDRNTNQRVVSGCDSSIAAERDLGHSEVSLKRDPRNPSLWTKKGVALYHLKRYEEGLVALNTATALKADLGAAWYWIGGCLYRLDRYGEALQAIDKAISLEPSQAQSMRKDREMVLAAIKKKETTTEKTATETNPQRKTSSSGVVSTDSDKSTTVNWTEAQKKIEALGELLDKKLISQEEYDKKKGELLKTF